MLSALRRRAPASGPTAACRNGGPSAGLASPRHGPTGLWGRLGGAAPLAGRSVLLALLLLPSLAQAAFLPTDRLADPAAEARAQAIGREVRCMVCQGQSIEDSDADLARDLRRIIRERLEAGDADPAVRGYLQNRYGDFILLRPPVSIATALLWGTPAFALLFGLFLVRRRRPVAASAPLTAAEQARLDELARR